MRRAAAALAALTTVAAAAGCASGTVRLPAPSPAPEARDVCRDLVERLPDTLVDQPRAEVEPDTPYAAAWGDPPIALRCGVARPPALAPDSELMVVEEVAWLAEPPAEPNLYTAVGREVYVELTLPPSYGPPAQGLVRVSELIAEEIPALPSGEL
ncbi:DUF3515 domain-containing protein [Streptomonospora nanhaiensis]|uniref:DUF3515 domain-containing protein n=1 Tax=Streptomonospora nanhaiensis TaxID=1323731 RepID=A0A853BQS6_9ACTN|nr:DUF3515 domain-containing protein [Streptomonospora nanhaiensis]MBV2362594.1 DUF3515 domain-containing protein [Streptomonospora nanhaiensis]MBX9386873.1 DUF3515 domain-containing protein [Streptomonospora nanhaiensis]NYI98059.1 hypothetical protein [Streptomonospora nanhaiensis]